MKSVRRTNGYNLPARSLFRLFRGITSNYNEDFYCLGCLHSFCTDNVLDKHERLCDSHDYCHVEMSTEDNTILKYNHREKSLKAQFIIFFDVECLLKKEQSCQNNAEKSYTERKAKHEPSPWAMFTKCSFDEIENKFDYKRRIDCIKKWCKQIRDCATEIIYYKEKEMISLKDKEKEFYEKQEVCHICKREFCNNKNEEKKFKLYQKIRDHCHYTGKFRRAAHSICILRYKVPKEIPVVIHNGSTQ